jgi:Na+/phosphate symporter
MQAGISNEKPSQNTYHLITNQEKDRQERMHEVQKKIDKLKRELSKEEVDRIEKEHKI